MSEQQHHDDVRFEATDVSTGPVVQFLFVLFLAMTGFMVLLWYVQAYLIRSEESDKRPANMIAVTAHGQLPPEPRIEGIGGENATHSVNRTDLATSAAVLKRDQERSLKDGWTDAGGGKHPPIDEAIRRLVAELNKGGKP